MSRIDLVLSVIRVLIQDVLRTLSGMEMQCICFDTLRIDLILLSVTFMSIKPKHDTRVFP